MMPSLVMVLYVPVSVTSKATAPESDEMYKAALFWTSRLPIRVLTALLMMDQYAPGSMVISPTLTATVPEETVGAEIVNAEAWAMRPKEDTINFLYNMSP